MGKYGITIDIEKKEIKFRERHWGEVERGWWESG